MTPSLTYLIYQSGYVPTLLLLASEYSPFQDVNAEYCSDGLRVIR